MFQLFKQDSEAPQCAMSVWAAISRTWERKKKHPVVSQARHSRLDQIWQDLTEEQQEHMHELNRVPKAVWALVAKSQFKLQANAFRA